VNEKKWPNVLRGPTTQQTYLQTHKLHKEYVIILISLQIK